MNRAGETLATGEGAPGATTARKASGAAAWAVAGVVFALGFPNAANVQRHLGAMAAVLYLVAFLIGALLLNRFVLTRVLAGMSDRASMWAAVALIAVLFVGFLFFYPRVRGSDRDEALDQGTRALLHARYPYYERTYVPGEYHRLHMDGNPLSPLPGEFILAVPFVLIKWGALEVFPWLLAFYFAARRYLRSGRLSFLLLLATFCLAPVFLAEVAQGGDLLPTTLYMTIAAYLAVDTVSSPKSSTLARVLSCVFLGFALSTRFNFAFVLPLIWSAMWQNAGPKKATLYTGLAFAVFAGITAPFYFYDPANFSPMHVTGYMTRFNSVLPHALVIMPGLTFLLAAVLSFTRMRRDWIAFFRNAAAVIAFPIVLEVVLASLSEHRLSLTDFGWYGMAFTFFGLLAGAAKLARLYGVGGPPPELSEPAEQSA